MWSLTFRRWSPFCPSTHNTDFGWTWFGPSTKEGMDMKKRSELMNGRLAMFAVGGIATQSIINGHGFPYV
jgi:hypothetical protein